MNSYKTGDLYVASMLRLHGLKLIGITKENDKGIFIFQDKPDRPALVRDYFSGQLAGSLKHFASLWSDLKNLAAQTKEGVTE